MHFTANRAPSSAHGGQGGAGFDDQGGAGRSAGLGRVGGSGSQKAKQKTSTGAKAELEITTAVQVEQKSLSLRSIAPPKKCLGGSGIDMSTVKEDPLSWRVSSTNSQTVP